jgi:hypothetical protein
MKEYVKVYDIDKFIAIFNLNGWDLGLSEYRESCINRYKNEIRTYWYKYFCYNKLCQHCRESFIPREIEGRPFKLVMTIR